ncbi:MAG: hypothetical protein KUG78_18500 [Kangiellaceae bacterium]|nr:hypothetical protein [Kangiellaceae bacterium]
MSEEKLWKLVESAFSDNRLLLLVDGLDEWSDEQTATVCFQKLSVFVSTNDVTTILSTRQSGLDKFPIDHNEFSVGYLAGLSDNQQERLVRACISYRLQRDSNHDSSIVSAEIDKQIQEMLVEISANKDLGELSSVPLLLYMLIHLKTKNISLPHSRFSVYKELVNDLVRVHPKRRKTAANVINFHSDFNENEVLNILSKLAFNTQSSFSHGEVPLDAAEDAIKSYLMDGNRPFGFAEREAISASERLIEIAEDEVGILVKTSRDELVFFHRSFQEFLASSYIANEPQKIQEEVISRHALDLQWRDVIIGVFSLISKGEDIENLINLISSLHSNDFEKMYIETLLAEIAFGDTACSSIIAKNIADTTYKIIEESTYFQHSKQLLDIALSGFRSNKIQSDLKNRINKWTPANKSWLTDIFDSIKQKWPNDELTMSFLLWGLKSDSGYSRNRRSATLAISSVFSGEEKCLSEIAKLAKSTLDRNVRLACTEAAIRGWHDSKITKIMVNSLSKSSDQAAQLLGILYRAHGGNTSDKDRDFVLKCTSGSSRLDHTWNDIATEILCKGYPNDPIVREACINRLFHHSPDFEIAVAESVLLTCFASDPIVLPHLIKDFSQDHPICIMQFSCGDPWSYLKAAAEISSELKVAIKGWIINRDRIHVQSYFFLDDDEGKNFLIQKLLNDPMPYRAGEQLINHWGLEDNDVSTAFNKLIKKGAFKASQIAPLYPAIFKDKDECFQKLLRLIKSRSKKKIRYDLIQTAIFNIATKNQLTEAYNLFASLECNNDVSEKGYMLLRFGHYLTNSDIRETAKNNLKIRDGNVSLVASIFHDDLEIRSRLVESQTTLDAPMRLSIAEYFSKNNRDEFSLQVISKYDNEVDSETKVQSAIAYYTSPLYAHTNRLNEKLERLASDIIVGGPDHEERRQAAFCGFVALEEAHRVLEINDPWGKENIVKLSSLSGIRKNEVFLRYVAENWTYLAMIFKDDIYSIVLGSDNKSVELLACIAPYINSETKFINEFRDMLLAHEGDVGDRVLLSASSLIQQHEKLLIMCLRSIGCYIDDKSKNDGNRRNSLIALNILEHQFDNHDFAKSTLDRLAEEGRSSPDKLYAAHNAIGYTDCEFARNYIKESKGKLVWLPAAFMSLSNTIGAKNKVSEILKMTSHVSQAKNNYSSYFISHVSKMIANEESLYREIVREYKATKSTVAKLSLLIFAFNAKGLDGFVLKAASELYERQKRKRFPDLVFDISIGEAVPLTYSLTRILYNNKY